MTRKKARGRGLSPAAAVLLLAVCGGVSWFSLGKSTGTVAGGGDGADTSAVGDLEPEGAESQASDGEDKAGRDLLAEHGSWQRLTPVRMAFISLTDAVMQAAPAAETNASAGVRWIGADPPALQVGVVMVGETVRRAVVKGMVVGVGDNIDRVTIVGIERDVVSVTFGGRRLTYDLENEYPREFRGELERRKAARTAMPASESKQYQEGQ